jgi:hypothetical protein
MKTLGIILIVLGACMLIWTGFNYTQKEKIIDVGPLEISAEKEKSVNWPPYVGIALIAAGSIIFITSRKT